MPTYADIQFFVLPSVTRECNPKLLAEVESRTQGLRPRPRTARPRTDTLEAKDRNVRGQGLGPRTQTLVFSKKKEKKKVFKKIYQAISKKKNGLAKKFSADLQNFNHSKKYCSLRAEDTAIFEDLTFEAKNFNMYPRGLHLWLLELVYLFLCRSIQLQQALISVS